MSSAVDFIPVTRENLAEYVKVGLQSYKEHYLHLWENADPTPFVEAYLTQESVEKALNDPLQLFYIVKYDQYGVGVLNITLDAEKGVFLKQNNLLLNKIYLLKSYSGIGVGSATLDFVHQLAKKHNKEVVWLYAMKKGKPLHFYKKHGYEIIKKAMIDLPNVLEEEKEMWLMAKTV